MKKCSMILTEKQQKHQHYHHENLININILQVKAYCFLMKDKQQNNLSFAYSPLGKVSLTGGGILPSNQRKTTEQTRFAYSPLGKAFRKQTKTSEDQA